MSPRIKHLLPKGLLGRSLMILVTPLLLVQLVSAFVFYTNHWEALSRRLAIGVASDVRTILDLLQQFPDPINHSQIMEIANKRLDMVVSFHQDGYMPHPLPPPKLDHRERILYRALEHRLQYPFTVNTHSESHYGIIVIQLPDSVMEIVFPSKRLYSFTTSLFLVWMAGTTLLMMLIATVFMRNQVRAVLRLATAADLFGKGLEGAELKLEGATEVRKVAQAFNIMRQRIGRQIQQRTSMLAGVSHDLRTPLTRMKLQLAMMEGVDGVEDMAMDVAEMEMMIDGYLAFARGEGTEKPETVNLMALMSEVVISFVRQGHSVNFVEPPPLDMILRPSVMRRALANIIGNAVRYGTNVTVSVEITKAVIVIAIDDDGPGIPSEMRDEMFKPFRRLEESRNLETGGVGLGLSIAQDVVRGHGGDISLGDSDMGGLRVTIRLPR